MLHVVYIDCVFWRLNGGGNCLGSKLQPIGSTRNQSLVCHPDNSAFKLVGHLGRIVCSGNHISARTVDFVCKAQGDRLACNGFAEFSIERDNLGYR